MKRKFVMPSVSAFPCDLSSFGDVKNMSDAELKLKMEENGYQFTKTFQSKSNYIHRKVADSDVLISIGENVANFNGYIELNASAACLWEQMKEPQTSAQLEKTLEETFGISHEQAVADVLDFLKELQIHDMVLIQ